jgi:hypothetical protein
MPLPVTERKEKIRERKVRRPFWICKLTVLGEGGGGRTSSNVRAMSENLKKKKNTL